MAEVIRMPRMSDTMEEGNIVSWLKQEGDTVESGETIAEVETDKATMELDSYHDGVLLHIAVKEGAVPINGVIAVIGEEGEDWKAAIEAENADQDTAEEADAADTEAADTEKNDTPEASNPEPATAAADTTAESNASQTDKRIKASPLAKSMAKDAGIELSTINGTGDNGRIIKRDVEDAIHERRPAPAATTATDAPATPAPDAAPVEDKSTPKVTPFAYNAGGDNYEEQPITQMRKTIARRLGESKFQAPHFYLTIEIDMRKAMKTRTRLNEVSPVRISFNDLVVKAAAIALRSHPAINSSWLGDKIRINRDINVGVAVAVEEGLLVPVIRYADIKTLSQISSETRELAGKAKNKKLQPNEMQGNTFTISNLGMFGIEEFTAIINPPDSCIMAVGGIMEKPIVSEGKIKIGKQMKVTLSCDHRTVDGATGAQFLQTFKEILEEPVRLLV